MGPVVRRSIENIFSPAKPIDEFSMYPELVNEVESMHQGEHPRSKTQEHDRCVKDPVRDARKPALAAGDAQIEMLARMVNHVKIPKESRLVTDSVKPVINKIVHNEQRHPCPPGVSRKLKRGDAEKKGVSESGCEPKNDAKSDTPETENDVCRRVDGFVELV